MLRPSRRSVGPRWPRLWPRSRVTLSDAFRAWLADNLARGVARPELLDALVHQGVPRPLAARELDAIAASPAWPGCELQRRRADRQALVLRLLREASANDPTSAEIERRGTIDPAELRDRYMAHLRPVVLTRILDGWPALGKWTPEHLASRYGDVDVEIMTGRDADAQCDRNLDAHRRTVKLAEYTRMIEERSPTNDLYMVSNNRALEEPGLSPLLDDLTPPPEIFRVPVKPGDASLWFGPAGTVTPLHHDTTHILICQLHGRKKFDLVSPLAAPLAVAANGYFAPVRAADLGPDTTAGCPVLRFVLSAGEALFLPAGWWHEVTALDVSIHVSLLSFHDVRPVPWYVPGLV